jgi:hypothetical protein
MRGNIGQGIIRVNNLELPFLKKGQPAANQIFSNTPNSPPTKPTEPAQPVFVGSVASVFTSS